MKKFFKYFFIVLISLLSLTFVGLLFLFFVPNTSVFGIRYVSVNQHYISEKVDANTVNNIVINSSKFKIDFANSTDDSIYVDILDNSFGYVQNVNATSSITTTNKNGILTFDIKETHGFSLPLKSNIVVFLPSDKIFDLKLSNDSADTNIYNGSFSFGNFEYGSNSGTLSVNNASITGNIKIHNQKGDTNFGSAVTTNNNNLDISVATGSINAPTLNFGNVTINQNDKGSINIKSCDNLIVQVASAGRLNAESIKTLNIKSSDIFIYTKQLTDSANVTLINGGIHIENMVASNKTSDFTISGGSLTLNDVSSKLILSVYGNVNIINARNEIVLTSASGNVNINFAESEYSARKISSPDIQHGIININNVDNINFEITGSASVNVKMNNILNHNKIICKDNTAGSISLEIKYDLVYNLLTSSYAGNVKVNLIDIEELDGYEDKTLRPTSVNGGNVDITLTLHTYLGSLNVVDNKMKI